MLLGGLCVIIAAVVIATLWGWLAVPIFGLRALNYWQAIGIGLLIAVFQPLSGQSKSKDDKENNNSYIETVVALLVALLLGYLIKTFGNI